MSDLWLNLRIGLYHLQGHPRWPFLTWSRNDFHRGRKSPWLELYTPFYLALGGEE